MKLLVRFADWLEEELLEDKTLADIKDRITIIQFLDTKRKSKEDDPDQKSITTWNDYLWRLKYFFRWLYNHEKNPDNIEDWLTPQFIQIRKKRQKG